MAQDPEGPAGGQLVADADGGSEAPRAEVQQRPTGKHRAAGDEERANHDLRRKQQPRLRTEHGGGDSEVEQAEGADVGDEQGPRCRSSAPARLRRTTIRRATARVPAYSLV